MFEPEPNLHQQNTILLGFNLHYFYMLGVLDNIFVLLYELGDIYFFVTFFLGK